MKILFRTTLFTLLAVACAYGRGRASGYCQQGGQTIQVLGYVSSAATPVQGSYTGNGCNVLVLYSNGGGTTATGPSGIINTSSSGNTIMWLSGNVFNANGQWTGLTITINAVSYTISTCSSATTCTLTSSPGNQTSVAYGMSAATPAAIFSDNAGTGKSNPFVVSSTGYWFYYADNGSYANQYSGTAIQTTYTNAALPLSDPSNLPNVIRWNATLGTTLAQQCAAATAAPNTAIVIDTVAPVATGFTALCPIIMYPGGLIQPASGQTVTIGNVICPPLQQCYDNSLSGTIAFSYAAQVTPNNWGAVGDNSTDNSFSFNSAGVSGAATVYIPAGIYIAQNVSPSAGQTWTGPGTLKLKPNGTATSAEPMFLVVNSGVRITGLTFALNSANVLQNTTANNLVDQPAAASCYSPTLDGVVGFEFDHNNVTDGAYEGVTVAGCSDVKIHDNTFNGLYSGGVQTAYGCRTGCANNGNIAVAKIDVSGNDIVNITQPATSGGAGIGINFNGPTIGFTASHNRIQAFSDGVSNDGTRETIGIQVYGQNAGLSGGLPTFPLHGTISDNTVNTPWNVSIAGAQDVSVTGNTFYASSNTNASNMSFALTGSGGAILCVEIVASQYVTVKGNNCSARAPAPGLGFAVGANCTTCFVNFADHILIEDNQISGFVGGIDVDTGLSSEGAVFASCPKNTNSAYADQNGLIQIKNNEITDYRLFGVLIRSAVLAEVRDNYISSAQGAYGSCGTTSTILIGAQLTKAIIDGNTLIAQQIMAGDIATGGSVSGNSTILYLTNNKTNGGYVNLLNANGAQYHIEGNDFQEAPGNQDAVAETTNDPSVPIWGLNNTFEGYPMASTTATAMSGSTSMTVASATGIQNGEYMRCAGIQPGTGVVSGGGTTSLVLSLATTAGLSSTPCTFYAPWIVAFTTTGAHAQGSVVLSGNNIPVQTALNGGSLANWTTYGPVCGPFSYANIPPNQKILGQHCWIADSTTNTWGATISGSGGDSVEGVYDGANWTVVAK